MDITQSRDLSIRDLSIRDFLLLSNEAVEYMKKYTELTPRRVSVEKMINRMIDKMILAGLRMTSPYEHLLRTGSYDVIYLSEFLILGLMVNDGMAPLKAYLDTVGKRDSAIERFLAKRLLREEFFRKLNINEEETIRNIREIYQIYKK